MAKTRFILSIDGGGIRGLIPAIVLAELEARLARAGKAKPLHSCFDLIAGTSTGGIIAAGLAAPKPGARRVAACTAADLVALYEEDGPRIFQNGLFDRVRAALANPAGLLDERYDAGPLEDVLAARLGDRRISEALTLVMLTAYDTVQREAVFMTNCKGSTGRASDDFLFREAARASSAAPTYFEPALVFNLTRQETQSLVDGGVFANDPALAALIEAKKQGWREDDLFLLSLGTGENNRAYPYAEVRHWGIASWLSPARGAPLISILMQGQSSTVAYQMRSLLGADRYARIDGKLTIASDDLDDASPQNLVNLRRQAEAYIRAHTKTLDDVVERLVA